MCACVCIYMHTYNPFLFSPLDVFVGLLDLPEELNDLTDINSAQFLSTSSSNSIIDQSHQQQLPPTQQMDMSMQQQTSNMATPPSMAAPANMATPPINNISSSTGTPSPSNVSGISSQLVGHGSATPPPNAVVSTSGDPTPTLPSISSSPSHSVSLPPSSSLPPPVNMTNSPYQVHNPVNMYNPRQHHMGMHPQGGGVGGGAMHGSYGMPRAGGYPPHPGMQNRIVYNNPHMVPHQPMMPSGGMAMDPGYSAPPPLQMMHHPMGPGGMYQPHAPPPHPQQKIDVQPRPPQQAMMTDNSQQRVSVERGREREKEREKERERERERGRKKG